MRKTEGSFEDALDASEDRREKPPRGGKRPSGGKGSGGGSLPDKKSRTQGLFVE